jgi:hypothetical protein
MKKKMIVLLAAAMMTLAAGNAFAFYGNLDLVEVFYNTTTNQEAAIDLGSLTANTAGGYNFAYASAAPLSVNSTTAGMTLGTSTQVAFYALDNANSTALVSSTNGAPTQNSDYQSTIYNAASQMQAQGYTTGQGAGINGRVATLATGTAGFPNGFIDQMRTSGLWYAGYVNAVGEANLSTAAAANLGIYGVNDVTVGSGAVALDFNATVTFDGTNAVTSLTNDNGTGGTAPATPIPAAAYLLGSGLLGLFGLRRKQKA